MYANSFFNTSIMSLKTLLSKEGSKLRVFLYSNENPFIESYGNQWGTQDNNPRYESNGLRENIKHVKSDLKRLKENAVRSSFELFEIKHAPIAYSFYRIDNDLYFVPSKNTKSREFKPAVLHFTRTKSNTSLYSKVQTELDQMIKFDEVQTIVL